MTNNGKPDDDSFYEVEIDGKVIRISRSQINELRDELLNGKGDLTNKLQAAFRNHPNVDPEATEDAPLIGNEPDQVD